MNLTSRTSFKQRWLVAVLMILSIGLGLYQIVGAAEYGLGDIPLDPETYQKYLRVWPEEAAEALPTSYDARTEGIVTSPKNQGNCGSCWSFASTGAFESHLLKEFSFGPTDLSEQQQVSCNLSMSGCCGGLMSSLQYWETQGPIYESCFPYGESGTSCPTQRTVSCSDASGCEQLVSRVINYYTVSPSDFKTSLYNDGPSYWRYDVYRDFSYNGTGFWYDAGPGDVYVNSGGTKRGGHAVLIIGWDDNKGAYLCKNSWGATGGPNGDGTFWIAYSGHYYDLGFGMANFNLSGAPGVEGMYEIRLDNTDPEHTITGTWTEKKVAGAYGNNTIHFKSAGAGSAYFRYLLPSGDFEAAEYAIYARWITHSSMATNTRYEVWYAPGVNASVRVNQQANPSSWVKLGTWDCSGRPVVRVYDDADGRVVADGIRYVRTGASSTPALGMGLQGSACNDEVE